MLQLLSKPSLQILTGLRKLSCAKKSLKRSIKVPIRKRETPKKFCNLSPRSI